MKTILKILSFVALIIWCICFALGYNFHEGGNLTMSSVLAFFLLGLMAILIYLMTLFSKPKNANQTKINMIKEIACGVCYAVLFALSCSMVAQFITVETRTKSQVQPLAQERINELYKAYADQDEAVAGSYWAYIDEKAGLYEEHVRNTDTAPTQDQRNSNAATQMNELIETLLGGTQFEETQSLVIDFLEHCDYAVENWVPWSLPRYLGELDNNLPKWEKVLVDLSVTHNWTKSEPYAIDSVADANLLDMVKHPEGGNFSALAIIMLIVMQIVILLPYFIGRDWATTGPQKGVSSSNDGITVFK